MSLITRILATIWIIVASALWARFFYLDPFSEAGSRMFNFGYSWLAIGAGGALIRKTWLSYREHL